MDRRQDTGLQLVKTKEKQAPIEHHSEELLRPPVKLQHGSPVKSGRVGGVTPLMKAIAVCLSFIYLFIYLHFFALKLGTHRTCVGVCLSGAAKRPGSPPAGRRPALEWGHL